MIIENEAVESSLFTTELEQPLEAEELSLPSELSETDDSLEAANFAANDSEFSYETALDAGFAANLEAPQYEAVVI